jgi:hypothetical protein
VQTAAGTLRDLRVAEVVKMDVKIEDGKVTEFRTRYNCRLSTKASREIDKAAVGPNRCSISLGRSRAN